MSEQKVPSIADTLREALDNAENRRVHERDPFLAWMVLNNAIDSAIPAIEALERDLETERMASASLVGAQNDIMAEYRGERDRRFKAERERDRLREAAQALIREWEDGKIVYTDAYSPNDGLYMIERALNGEVDD